MLQEDGILARYRLSTLDIIRSTGSGDMRIPSLYSAMLAGRASRKRSFARRRLRISRRSEISSVRIRTIQITRESLFRESWKSTHRIFAVSVDF